MNVNFQPSKVRQGSLNVSYYKTLSLFVLMHAPAGYSTLNLTTYVIFI